ncbi:MAG: thiamine pyrophosphate-dependent dehydrogenase E1 component subunit alpha [Verrucomicrobia bacterium]|nr:thiamine pyrophosphate-dependent dehydrogenase E1 component subunit alpha [Verrucomicrobiota bacterium]
MSESEPALLLRLYRELVRLRVVEERIAELYPEQDMRCPVHLSIGQEAVPVGVCAHLGPADYALSGHRSHGHYLAKGGDLRAMLAEIYGRATGCSRGKGGSMHLVDLEAGFLGATPIVGSTIPIAVGAALGAAMRGEPRLSVAFFGEGATEEGVFHESLNFATLKRLPVLFVCENNLYSVYSPLEVRQPPGRSVRDLAAGHGLATASGDGNDVLAVYRLAGEAIARIRRGEGPALLEFATYRWREHCGPNYDNQLGYRTEAEFRQWQARCPLSRARAALEAAGVSAAELEAAELAPRAEVDAAVAYAKASPYPNAADLASDLYAAAAPAPNPELPPHSWPAP